MVAEDPQKKKGVVAEVIDGAGACAGVGVRRWGWKDCFGDWNGCGKRDKVVAFYSLAAPQLINKYDKGPGLFLDLYF